MSEELERIAAIEDPFVLLRVATERLQAAQAEVTELSRLRRRVIQDLHAKGMSYAQIAEKAGLSRGRIHQIRHTGPAPEGAFLGSGKVTIVTPLRQDTAKARAVVALDDLTAGKRLEDLARTFGLTVEYEHVPVDGRIDLNRPGLIVICGPRMSQDMRELYEQDPVLRWEKADDSPWMLRDTHTGKVFRSGIDSDSPRPYDVAYLGRLPRPDGEGTVTAIAGVHTQGSLGVVHLLATEIGTLWGQVGTRRFSTVVGVEYDQDTHEPLRVELLTPLYRHEEA
ncbi:RNA polymerase subunit sigma-24 [Carbonactinospora thermoautotrophica]|uniref:sigma factor-like helix-turn-helix DNA-binding protein n=1 Tax=Carbonactinospora thermoautotrophica TaxID=1469144 RepID=UPI002271711F|nr:sigma factor-like helix-turn-helix DNA-binding protein [Carbonactinospora thermoautotrophica]MCX9192094.1 RNA polymerase subunit sigma-24 [Carbonactinospora thermoautotrophica]